MWRKCCSMSALMLFAGVLATAQSSWPRDQIPSLSRNDLANGKRIFNGQCVLCHGVTGTGSRGPALNQPTLRRAATNAALFRIIKEGIDGSEMPQFWQLTNREIWQVAGYVRSLGRVTPSKLSGNAARGQELFEKKGTCLACHIVSGEGGVSGPDLTEIGASRSPAYLREALIDPNATTPKGFLVVSVTAANGQRVRGVRLNEDSFSIQLRDEGNRTHSFRKSELKELKKEFGVSLMPAYKETLSASEIEDLVAYMAGLRGTK